VVVVAQAIHHLQQEALVELVVVVLVHMVPIHLFRVLLEVLTLVAEVAAEATQQTVPNMDTDLLVVLVLLS
jgi:hypothetical protein